MNSYTPIQQLPTCKKMNKILFKLGLANFVLLILYLILDLMAWRSILIFPYVASWFWTPLSIRYWTSTTSDFDPVLSNNVFSIYNWSIIVLLGIIALNLIAVWKITQTPLPRNSQKWKTFCPPYTITDLVGWIKVYPEEAARFIVLASSNVAVIVLQGVGHYYSNSRKESHS